MNDRMIKLIEKLTFLGAAIVSLIYAVLLLIMVFRTQTITPTLAGFVLGGVIVMVLVFCLIETRQQLAKVKDSTQQQQQQQQQQQTRQYQSTSPRPRQNMAPCSPVMTVILTYNEALRLPKRLEREFVAIENSDHSNEFSIMLEFNSEGVSVSAIRIPTKN